MNVAEKVKLIKQGLLSSEKLCEECITNIERNDKEGKGLNAIAMICEDWRQGGDVDCTDSPLRR